MRRALAFTRDIKRSKLIEHEFARVAEEWRDTLDDAVAANDAEELDELLKGIVTVSSAWRQLRQ